MHSASKISKSKSNGGLKGASAKGSRVAALHLATEWSNSSIAEGSWSEESAASTKRRRVVRRIFEGFAAGKSPRAIAKLLNAHAVPGPNGRPWCDTMIRGHRLRGWGILHYEIYIGRLIWNRQSFIKDPTTGRRVPRCNPEAEWIVQDVPELREVDQTL